MIYLDDKLAVFYITSKDNNYIIILVYRIAYCHKINDYITSIQDPTRVNSYI